MLQKLLTDGMSSTDGMKSDLGYPLLGWVEGIEPPTGA